MLKIIISPAKKMNITDEYTCRLTTPAFEENARQLHAALLKRSQAELKTLWGCSEKLAAYNYEHLHTYGFGKNLTPALLSYEGIQYQYMAPHIFSDAQWRYAEQHLRILSGFYGILRPTDGVIPYRLEMQAKIHLLNGASGSDKASDQNQSNRVCLNQVPLNQNGSEVQYFPPTLYAYWKDSLYQHLAAEACESGEPPKIVNLASAEYSKAILPYLTPPVTQVSCVFGEWVGGKVKVKGTQAKMARGEMVRWMAEHQVEDVEELKKFTNLDYRFFEALSSENEFVFLKK